MGRDTLDKVLSGLSDRNIRFDDIKKLIMDFGFDCRIKGGHHIFSKGGFIKNIGTLPILFIPFLLWTTALLWKKVSLQYPLQFFYESFTAKRSAC